MVLSLREVVRWAMHKLGVEEWLVLAAMSTPMYTGAKTVVKTVYDNSNGFEVKVSVHQGSALNLLLFVIVMEALSREFRVALELLYADDLVVIAETEDDVIKRLNEWKDFVVQMDFLAANHVRIVGLCIARSSLRLHSFLV